MITVRNTDDFLFGSKFIRNLCEKSNAPEILAGLMSATTLPEFGSADDPGCILFVPDNGKDRAVRAPLRKQSGDAVVSVSRAAFAAARANAGQSLSATENAIHLCSGERIDENGRRRPCINPAHVRPESRN